MNLCTSVVQFGLPMISVGAVGAMMGAIVASMLDSCADYIAYARTMGYPMPPKHAVNRGIAVEGMATILCGINYSYFKDDYVLNYFLFYVTGNVIILTYTFNIGNSKQIQNFASLGKTKHHSWFIYTCI